MGGVATWPWVSKGKLGLNRYNWNEVGTSEKRRERG